MGLSPPFPHRCLLRDDEKLTDILGLFFGFVKCLFFSWTVDGGYGLPRALRALAMTGVFARSAGALLMVWWVGNRKGRPSGKYG